MSVRRARKALLAKGTEAVEYAISTKMDTRSSLVSRLLTKIVEAMPDTAGPLLVEKLTSTKDEQTIKNSARFLSAIKWEPAVEPMLDMLDLRDMEKVRNSLISALGQIGDKRAAGRICRYVTDRQERRRLAAIGALGSIRDTTTIRTLIRGLNDLIFTVRSAAAGALMKFGTPAIYDLRNYVTDGMALYPEIGLRALGRIIAGMDVKGDVQEGKYRYEAVLLFEANLSHPDEQMRAAAVDALYRNSGEATRRMIDRRMETEYSPVVISAYDKVVGEFE